MIDEKDFLPQLRAAMRPTEHGFALDEQFVHDALSGLGAPPSQVLTGKPSAKTDGGLLYEEVGWDCTVATCGPNGRQLLTGDPVEMAVSMFATFFAQAASRRSVDGHDVFEFRIYPEISVSGYGRVMKFYARLSSHQSNAAMRAEIKRLEVFVRDHPKRGESSKVRTP